MSVLCIARFIDTTSTSDSEEPVATLYADSQFSRSGIYLVLVADKRVTSFTDKVNKKDSKSLYQLLLINFLNGRVI